MAEKRTETQLTEKLDRLHQRVDEPGHAISRQNRVMQELGEDQGNLQPLFDATNDLILVLDTDGTILQANRMVCERLGYTRVELSGKSVLDIHPPDRREEAAANFTDLLAGKTSSCPIPLLCSDGSLIHVESRVAKGKWGGKDVLFCISKDITERQQAEGELRASEERLRAQYKAIPVPTYTWRKVEDDFVLADYNDAAAKSTLGKISEFLGTKARELHNDRPDIVHDLWRCITDKVSIEREMPYQFKTTGETKYLRVKYAYALPDLVLLHTEDITERKRVEDMLLIKDSALRSSMNAVAIASLDGHLEYVNPAFLRMWGYEKEEEIMGRSAGDFWEPQEKADEVMQALRDRGAWSGELTAKRKDQSQFRASLSASMVTDPTGQPIRMMGSFVDVTEQKRAEEAQKESEEKYRTLVENAGTPITYYALDGTILLINPVGAKNLGGTPDDFVGRSIYEVLPDIAEITKERVHQIIETGEASDYEDLVELPSGSFWFHSNFQPVRDTAGEIFAIQIVSQDITERKLAEQIAERAEQALEEQRIRAIRSDRLHSLGEIATAIAHELNQPLLGVRGLAEHLLLGQERQWEFSPEKTREKLELIVQQTERMTSIIEHIRKFSSGVVSREKLSVEVNDVVDSSIRLISTQMRSHGLSLECDLTDDLPQVLANPFSLEEVILNLLANARDAVEEKRREDPKSEVLPIVLRTFTDWDGAEQHVVIEIIDQGIGIPESILPNVFDPFFTTKKPDEGTGLGLTISKSIIEDFAGKIGIEVNTSGGTTARIVLPAMDHDGGIEKNGD